MPLRYLLLRPLDIRTVTLTPRGRFWSPATVPPAIIDLPTVVDPGEFGLPLTVGPGNWEGTAPVFTYQWLRDGVPIPGATGTSYTRNWHTDNGATITVQETATNAAGEVTATASNSVTATTDMLIGGYGWDYSWDYSDVSVLNVPPQDGGVTLTAVAGAAVTLNQSTSPFSVSDIGASRQNGAVQLDDEHWEASDAGFATTGSVHLRLIAQNELGTTGTTFVDYGGLTFGITGPGDYYLGIPGQPAQTFSGDEVDDEWLIVDIFIDSDGASGTTARLMINENEFTADQPAVAWGGVGSDLAVGGEFGSPITDVAPWDVLFLGIRHGVEFDFVQHLLDYNNSEIVEVAPVNVVPPVVTPGSPNIGDVLSTTDGVWSGYPSTTFAYQWQRNSGLGWNDIGGATNSTYTVVNADFDAELRCVVTADNVATAGVSQPSNAVGPVPGIAPTNDVAPGITGTMQVGQTLNVVPGTWSGVPAPTLSYTWYRDGSIILVGGNPVTGPSYTLVPADYNTVIQARETATNVAGSAFLDTPNLGFVAGTIPVNNTLPFITGSTQIGDQLTVTDGTWTATPAPTYTYEWRRESDDGVLQPFSGTNTYTIPPAEVGEEIYAVVRATNPAGNTDAEALAVGPVAGVAPSFGSAPVIAVQAPDLRTVGPSDDSAGTADTLEVTSTGLNPGANPTATLTYQWYEDGSPIAGATSSTYQVDRDNYALDITVVVTATNVVAAVDSPPSNALTVVGVPRNEVAPTVAGTGVLFDDVTASPGTWTSVPGGETYEYRFLRDGTTEVQAWSSSDTYTTVLADDDGDISVEVRATNGEGTSAVVASSNDVTINGLVPNGSLANPVINGTQQVGQVLTIDPDSANWTGVPAPTFTYEWFRSGAPRVSLQGPSSTDTYTLVAADYNETIEVDVIGTNIEGSDTVLAGPTGAIAGIAPTFAGAPVIALQLPDQGPTGPSAGDANTPDVIEVTDENLNPGEVPTATFSYDWRRDGSSFGAPDQNTYTLVEADYNANITVVITATNAEGSAVSVASNAIGPVLGEAPTVDVLPVITTDGSPQIGETISVDDGTWFAVPDLVAPGDFTYQWQRESSATPLAWTPAPVNSNGSHTVESDGGLVKTSSAGWTNSAFVDAGQTIPADGEISFSPGPGTPFFFVGLTTDPGANAANRYTTYDYSIYVQGTFGNTNIGENGSQRAGTPSYSSSDVFTIRRTGTTIEYLQNGVVYDTSSVPSTGTLTPVANVYSGAIGSASFGTSGFTDISGETNATYTLQNADFDLDIRAVVTADNGVSPAGEAAAVAVGPIAGIAPAFLGDPVIALQAPDQGPAGPSAGDANTPDILEVTDDQLDPTSFPVPGLSYDWRRNGSTIVGALDQSTYELQEDDYNANITVVITATSAAGSVVSNPSNAIGPVIGEAPTNDTLPVISGTATVGQTLSTTNGTWFAVPDLGGGDFTYQWQRDTGSGFVNIPDSPPGTSTSSTYTLVAADFNTDVRVQVTADNGVAPAATANAAAVTVGGVAPNFGANPVIAVQAPDEGPAGPSVGDAEPSDTLEVTSTGLDGVAAPSPTIVYEWRRNGVAIPGAPDQDTYDLVEDDIGQDITVFITATNGAGSDTATSNILVPLGEAPAYVTRPVITTDGSPQVGETISVDDGTWTDAPDSSFTYQWRTRDESSAAVSWSAAYPGVAAHTAQSDGGLLKTGGSAVATDSGFEDLTSQITATDEFIEFEQDLASEIYVGVTSDPGATGSSRYGTYDHAFRPVGAGGTIEIYENSTTATVTLDRVHEAANAYRIQRNGTDIEYYVNEVLVHTSAVAAASTLTPVALIVTVNGEVTRCDQGTLDIQNISGATNASYTIQNTDAGLELDAVVTANNTIAPNADAVAVAVGPIAGIAPNFISAPTIAHQVPTDYGATGEVNAGDANPSDIIEVTASGLDGNAVPTPTLTYDWRNNGGSLGAPNQDTYEVQDTDYLDDITVVITATNTEGTDTSSASNVITVQGEAPTIDVAPAVTGTTNVGDILTCSTGTWFGVPQSFSYQYQWQEDTGSGFGDIIGETSSTYTIVSANASNDLRCVVTADNGVTPNGTANSNSVAVSGVAPVFDNPPTIAVQAPDLGLTGPSVGDVNANDTLEVTADGLNGAASPSPTLAYSWRRDTNSPATWTIINGNITTGANGSIARGAGGSNAWNVVLAEALPLAVGDSITFARNTNGFMGIGLWNGTFGAVTSVGNPNDTNVHAFMEFRDTSGTVLLYRQGTGSGAGGSFNAFGGVAIGDEVALRRASANTIEYIRNGVVLFTETRTGSATLTPFFISFTANTEISPVNIGSNIEVGTASTYQVQAADYEADITVEITASNVVGSDTSISNALTVNGEEPANTALPAITGTTTVGQTLTVSDGTWTGFPALTSADFSYQWRSDRGSGFVNVGSNQNTYVLDPLDYNASVECIVTADNGEGSPVDATASAVGPIAGTVPVIDTDPVIQVQAPDLGLTGPSVGDANVNDTLELATAASTDGTETPAANITYEWFRDGTTSVGTGTTYQVQSADFGFDITVVATATNAAGSDTSNASNGLTVNGEEPANTVLPVISGTPTVDQVLSTTDGTWTGFPALTAPADFSYQWERDTGSGFTTISGATNSTYTLQPGDYNADIRVVVTADNGEGSPVSATSASVGPVDGIAPTIDTTPVISVQAPDQGQAGPSVGDANPDDTVEVSTLATVDGTEVPAATITYRWQRDTGSGFADITPAATGTTYQVTTADYGHDIRVVATASNTISPDDEEPSAALTVNGEVPANVTPPELAASNIYNVGQTIEVDDDGTWTGYPDPTV